MSKLFTSYPHQGLRKSWILSLIIYATINQSFGQTLTNNLPISEIAGTGTAIPTTYSLQQIPIGFSFSFYGTAYTDVYLAPNGALRFGTGLAGGSLPYNGGMLNAYYYPENRNMIAFALGFEVRPGVYGTPLMNYFTTGTAPNRVLVINFKNVSLNNGSLYINPDAIVSVQLQLYEGSNTIEVHNIKNKSFGTGFAYGRTFGISNSTGSLYPALPGYDGSYTFNLDNKMVRIQSCTPSAAPTFTKSATTIACGGDAVTLTGSGCASGSTYNWSNGQVGNPITVRPKLTTSYSVACFSADHCLGTSSASQSVTVTNSSPTISTAGTVICPSSTKTLTANVSVSGGTYQWFRNGILLSGSTSATYAADSATKFKVRYSVGSCVMLSDSVVMTRGVKPAKPTITGLSTYCAGGYSTLTANGCVGTINWVSGISSSSNSVNVSPAVATVYAATCTNADGCVSANSDGLTVSPITTSAPTISTTLSTVCGGDSITLTATGCSGTVQWNDGGIGNVYKRIISAISTTITAQCFDNGCTSINSNSLPITATQPSPTVSYSNSAISICAKDTTFMTASTTVTGGTWQWYKNGVAVSSGGTTNIYKAYQPGIYQVYYITGTCTTKSIPFSLTVQASLSTPVITSSVTTLCSVDYVSLSATGCAVDETTYWYRTSSGSSLITTGINPTVYQYNPSEIYSARCGRYNGPPFYLQCYGLLSNTVSVVITTTANPTGVTASVSTITCGGSTPITLTAAGCSGTYLWSANTNTTSTSATAIVTPTATTTYSVQCKSATGCLSPSSVFATVTVTNAIPNIAPSDTVSACPGTSGLLLTATTPTAGGTLQWANGSGNISGATTTTYTALTTDNYTVKQTVGACILTSKPTRVLIGVVKAPKISTGSTISCGATFFNFSSSGCSGTTTWSNGSTGASVSFYANRDQYVWAKCSTGVGCESPKSDSILVKVTLVDILPKKDSSFCVGGSYLLNASTGAVGLTYKWKLNGAYISGATSSSYSATTPGAYSLEVSRLGCTPTTIAVNLSTNVATVPVITGSTISCSLNPQKIWDKRFGGTDNESLSSTLSSSPTDYLFGGNTSSGQDGDKSQPTQGGIDFWVVKTDSSGTKLWDKRYGGSETDQMTSMIYTSDGNILLGGPSTSGISGDRTEGTRGTSDFWIVKTDISNGNKIWDKRYGGSSTETLNSMILTADNGFLLGGSSSSVGSGGEKTSPNKGNSDYWIVKTDANGIKLWDKNFGNPLGTNGLIKVIAVSGGYLLCGTANPSAAGGDKTQNTRGGYDFWIVKVDASGNKMWDKVIGGTGNDELSDAVEVTGGILLYGISGSGISGEKTTNAKGMLDYWLVKIDNSGNVLWDKTYGGLSNEFPSKMKVLGDGSIVMVGNSDSGISGDKTEASRGGSDYWIVKADANGNKIWDKTFGSNVGESLTGVIINSDDSYVFAGSSGGGVSGDKTQNAQGNNDFWIIKAKSCQATSLPSTIVAGQTVTLTANGCAGIITWSGGTTSTGMTASVTPTSTITYTATCTAAGCAATQSSTITLNVLGVPIPTISTVPSPAVACAGTPAVLTASGCPSGSTFVWTPSGSGMSISVTPAVNTSYTVACVVGATTGPASVSTLVKEVSQIMSVASGNYNIPATWDCNCVPLACSVVTINPLHNVVIPVTIIGKAKDVVMKGNLEIKPTGKLSLRIP
jgi:hypothetical protein